MAEPGSSPGGIQVRYNKRGGGVTACAFEVPLFDAPPATRGLPPFGDIDDIAVDEQLIEQEVDQLFAGVRPTNSAAGLAARVSPLGFQPSPVKAESTPAPKRFADRAREHQQRTRPPQPSPQPAATPQSDRGGRRPGTPCRRKPSEAAQPRASRARSPRSPRAAAWDQNWGEASPEQRQKSESFAAASAERARRSQVRARQKAQEQREKLEREADDKAKHKAEREAERAHSRATRAKEAREREYAEWKKRHFRQEQEERRKSRSGQGSAEGRPSSAHHAKQKFKAEYAKKFGSDEYNNKFGRPRTPSRASAKLTSSNAARVSTPAACIKLGRQEAVLRNRAEQHEREWAELVASKGVIRYSDVAWPEAPGGPTDNNLLVKYLLRASAPSRPQLLKALRMRWHPDKFQQLFGARLCPDDSPRISERIHRIFSTYLSG